MTKRRVKKNKQPQMFIYLDRVLDQVAKDKNMPKENLVDSIEQAFLSAAHKKWGHEGEFESQYNQENGEIELFQFKTVVETVEDKNLQMTLPEAVKLDPDAQMGDSIGMKLDATSLGRIAAQAAKQVLLQKVRESERVLVFQEYKDRVGEVIAGTIRRYERGEAIVDLGKAEAVIPRNEQVPGEHYKVNDRVQCYFLEINPERSGPMLVLSRRNPNLIRKLFEMEVPEISEHIVELKSVAREPGFRSKIAVASNDSDVDPVGACVGMKGSRVQSVVQELRGEKIDIVLWDADAARFVCNAIAPAEVVKVIVKDREKTMEVIVPDDQLSLAIGKKGQNVRLAAQLTGWNIDVLSETRLEELATRSKLALAQILSISDSDAMVLYSHGYRTFEEIAHVGLETFLQVPSLGAEKLKELQALAKTKLEEGVKTEHVFAELAKRMEEEKARLAAIKIEEEKARLAALPAADLSQEKTLEETPVVVPEGQGKGNI